MAFTTHEPATITTIKKMLQPDRFGAELALGVLSSAINDMLLMAKVVKYKNVTVITRAPNRRTIISVEERRQLTSEYMLAFETYLWMFEPNGRFEFWCNLLSIDPDYVRTLIRKEIKYYETKKRNRRNKDKHNTSG